LLGLVGHHPEAAGMKLNETIGTMSIVGLQMRLLGVNRFRICIAWNQLAHLLGLAKRSMQAPAMGQRDWAQAQGGCLLGLLRGLLLSHQRAWGTGAGAFLATHLPSRWV